MNQATRRVVSCPLVLLPPERALRVAIEAFGSPGTPHYVAVTCSGTVALSRNGVLVAAAWEGA